MKLIFATLLACASAIPINLTPEVAEATASHLAAHATASAGGHAALAPAQIASAYLADVPEVVAAKTTFKVAFDAAPDASLQAAGPVFTGVQIPSAYLADTAEVIEAKAAFKAAFDTAPVGPVWTGVPISAAYHTEVVGPGARSLPIPSAYLADTAEVSEAIVPPCMPPWDCGK